MREHYALEDRSGNRIVGIQSQLDLYSLIRTLRRLSPEADDLFRIVVFNGAGEPAWFDLREVLN